MAEEDPHIARPSLREENRRRTRQRIIQATAELTRETGRPDFSVPQVSQRSGVALRTIYRHFPTRQDLVDALATVADQAVALRAPQTLDDLEPWLRTAWGNLLKEEALLRAQHLGPAGAEIRRARIPLHRERISALLAQLCPGIDDDRSADLADLALLATSSTALFEFIDIIGISTERAARIAAGAVRKAIEAELRQVD